MADWMEEQAAEAETDVPVDQRLSKAKSVLDECHKVLDHLMDWDVPQAKSGPELAPVPMDGVRGLTRSIENQAHSLITRLHTLEGQLGKV